MVSIFSDHFDAGELHFGPDVPQTLTTSDVFDGLIRHLSGDWGDVTDSEWRENDAAVQCGGRLLSRYTTSRGTRFTIITVEDRSRTTVLLQFVH